MKYKLIAIDMDGTLLDKEEKVSEKNKEAIKRATEKGVKVVISTGRIFTSAIYYAKLIGIMTPIIACNGAYISEYDRENVLLQHPINQEDMEKLIEIFEKNNLYYHFYDNENFYTTDLDYNSLKYYEWNKKQKEENKININVLKNPVEYIKKNNVKVYKVVIMDEDIEKITNIREELSLYENIEVVSSWHGSLDIMYKGVSKGKALKELCKIYGISREEVIAIGDNENDLSMLEFAGTSVAMENGIDLVKEYADIVTETNDNNGVAKAIEKLIL
ncbi:HAD family phosphatase [Clostridium sp. D2Q-14]|uniref:Cof-type HAD-IIB family hydrolase n=1 Tax=Anaeromonas gelatinilytica TaxID=2683194 RepID=UPI00193BBDEB|nr:Cof-type HAD-IIB family hydrolase [Anaeromonas gelatinilytica]MBS4536594.1 HAD family phosphatase [Anaeromonas gelatinilytica]